MSHDTAPSHEAENQEQDDAAAQAQSVANDALDRSGDPYEESIKGGSADRAALSPDDSPDLIDRMEQMVSSGHIDMGAYRGEPAHDDEADSFGAEDDEIDDASGVHRNG